MIVVEALFGALAVAGVVGGAACAWVAWRDGVFRRPVVDYRRYTAPPMSEIYRTVLKNLD